MKSSNAIILVLIAFVAGYLIRMVVHPKKEDPAIVKEHVPFKVIKSTKGRDLIRQSFQGGKDSLETRAVLLSGEMLKGLVLLRDSIQSNGLRIYFASRKMAPGYDAYVIVGTDANGKDILAPINPVQKGEMFAQSSKVTDEVSYVETSTKYEVETCPKMCDKESPLYPERD